MEPETIDIEKLESHENACLKWAMNSCNSFTGNRERNILCPVNISQRIHSCYNKTLQVKYNFWKDTFYLLQLDANLLKIKYYDRFEKMYALCTREDITQLEIVEVRDELVKEIIRPQSSDLNSFGLRFDRIFSSFKYTLEQADKYYQLLFSQCTEQFHHDGHWDMWEEAGQMDISRTIDFDGQLSDIIATDNADEPDLADNITAALANQDVARGSHDVYELVMTSTLWMLKKTLILTGDADKSKNKADGSFTTRFETLKNVADCADIAFCYLEVTEFLTANNQDENLLSPKLKAIKDAYAMAERHITVMYSTVDEDLDDEIVIFSKQDQERLDLLTQILTDNAEGVAYWTSGEPSGQQIAGLTEEKEYLDKLKEFHDIEEANKSSLESAQKLNTDNYDCELDMCCKANVYNRKYQKLIKMDNGIKVCSDENDISTCQNRIVAEKDADNGISMAYYKSMEKVRNYCKRKNEFILEMCSYKGHHDIINNLKNKEKFKNDPTTYSETLDLKTTFIIDNTTTVATRQTIKGIRNGATSNADIKAMYDTKVTALANASPGQDAFILAYLQLEVIRLDTAQTLDGPQTIKLAAMERFIQNAGKCDVSAQADCVANIVKPDNSYFPWTSQEEKDTEADQSFKSYYHQTMEFLQDKINTYNSDEIWQESAVSNANSLFAQIKIDADGDHAFARDAWTAVLVGLTTQDETYEVTNLVNQAKLEAWVKFNKYENRQSNVIAIIDGTTDPDNKENLLDIDATPTTGNMALLKADNHYVADYLDLGAEDLGETQYARYLTVVRTRKWLPIDIGKQIKDLETLFTADAANITADAKAKYTLLAMIDWSLKLLMSGGAPFDATKFEPYWSKNLQLYE